MNQETSEKSSQIYQDQIGEGGCRYWSHVIKLIKVYLHQSWAFSLSPSHPTPPLFSLLPHPFSLSPSHHTLFSFSYPPHPLFLLSLCLPFRAFSLSLSPPRPLSLSLALFIVHKEFSFSRPCDYVSPSYQESSRRPQADSTTTVVVMYFSASPELGT